MSSRAWSSQAGFSLIESLVAAVVFSMVGGAILAAVAVVVKSDADQQARSAALIASRNYGDALGDTSYINCASPSDYDPAAVGLSPQSKSTVVVNSVTFWNKSALPSNTNPSASDWATAFDATCGSVDNGLQRVSYTVTSTVGDRTVTVTRAALKRFNGALSEPEPDPPPGGRVCVISSTSSVDSTWVNEDAIRRNTNYSTGSGSQELNILYLAGTRRFSYLRFNIAPGATCDNGGTLPASIAILSAQVRLYTFNIGGAPACGIQACWHVMERVRSNWAQSTLTWNNQPCPTGYGDSCQPGGVDSTILFEHGTGAFNWSARYQRVMAAQLLSDVQSFYNTPATNYGWVIKEACAIPYGKDCGSVTPGFQMRSSRATNVLERPTLTLWY